MNSRPILSRSIATLAFGLLPAVHGADYFWGAGGLGGTGTWIDDGTTPNWFNGATDVPWAAANTAIFGGAAGGAVTVSGTIAGVNALTFNTTGYALTGGTLALTGNAITLGNGVSASIGSALTGTTGLTLSGNGTLTLTSTTNALTGPITIAAGSTLIASGDTFATTGNDLVVNGTYDQTTTTALGSGRYINNLTGSGIITSSSAPANTVTSLRLKGGDFSGSIQDGAGTGQRTAVLFQATAGVLNLSGTNIYTGDTLVRDGGTLRLSGANALSSASFLRLEPGAGITATVELNANDLTRTLGGTQNAGTGGLNVGAGTDYFAALGADRALNLGAGQITWGTTAGFNPTILGFGSANATHKLTFTSPLSFGNVGRTIDVRDGSAAIEGEFTAAVTGGGAGGVLTKTGTGTLQLSGTNTIAGFRVQFGTVNLTGTNTGSVFNSIGVNAGNNATMNLTGAASLTTGAVDFNVSDLAGSRGTLNMNSTGTMTLGTLYVGKNGNSVGVFNHTSGTVMNAGGGDWRFGGVSGATSGNPDVLSYGIYNQSGGTINFTNNFQIGAGGSGVFNQTGGTLTNSGWIAPARFGAASNGLINLSGGSFSQTATAGTTLIIGEQGRAVVNVFPGGALSAQSSVGLRLSNQGGATGILNVLGGTVSAQSFVDLGGVSMLYLNGGTVRPLSNQANFINGLDQVVVGPNGAFFDSNSFAATIPQALTSPSGSGITDIAVATGGTGYVGEPIVLITGDGIGASARAVLTNGVVIGITITNPGVNYTNATVTLVGGGSTAAATLGAATFAPNVTTGGLSKTGAGTLTLGATNTYLGTTTVTGGKLALGATGDVNLSSGIVINGAGATFVQSSATPVTPIVTVTNGTLTGTTTVNTAVVGAGTGGIIGNGDGTAQPFTIGALTFEGAGAFNLTTTNTTPSVLTVGSLITGNTVPAGIVTLNAANTTGLWATGTYDLISYTTLGGAGFANIQRGTITGLGSRQNAVLNNAANIISLTISGDIPVWTGAGDGNWTTAVQTPKNWKLQASGTPTDYINNDSSLFDDTATGTTTLNISTANVSPASLTFNNSALNYVIGSTGGFGIAAGSIVKSGAAALSLGTANTFTGGVTLNAGTLNINHASALGTGAFVLNGGIFDNTSGAPITLTTNNTQTWNVDPVFGGTNDLNLGTAPLPFPGVRTITTNGTAALTLGGVISGAGAGLNKLGPGRLVLAGANTYTGTTDVNAGTLIVTGAINAASTPEIGQISVENNGVLRLQGGTINATKGTNPTITAGNIGGSTGAIYIEGGTLNITNELWLGSPAGGFGGLTVSGGTVSNTNWLAIGRTGNGVLDQSGGTISVAAQNAVLASFVGANGVANLSGGTLNVNSTAANQGAFIVGEAGTGALTVSGTAALNIAGALGVNIARVANGVGVVNLRGGTITAPAVTKGAGTTALFNFHGGTLRPTAASATFMQGLNGAYIYGGGANIDTNGQNITVAQPLLAPTGSGVSNNGLTVSGSGFITPPLIQVTGGGGTGATAIPVLDALGNLTGITITNPGTDYTSDPFFTVVGGGGTGLITGANVLVPVGSGGLTKLGAGVLTLSGVNTYAGETLISGGTLLLNATGTINDSDVITINGANARFVQANTTIAVVPSVVVTNGTLDGIGTVSSALVGHNTGGRIANGNGTTGALTVGNLTFQGTAAVNLNVGSTAPSLITTTLATNAAGTVTINPSNVAWVLGQYNLISYSTLGGAGFGAFTLGTVGGLNSRQVATLSNPAGFIALTISGDSLVWTGAGDGTWSTATQTPKNWKLKNNGGTTDYVEADAVEFDDTATGPGTVTINAANVNPSSVTFDNSARDYTISGLFGISGGLLVKRGTRALTLATNNSYPNGTTFEAGTLNVNTLTALGTGALTISGGTLDNTSAGDLTLTTNNAVNVLGDFTFAGTRNLNLGEGNVALGGSGTARTINVAAGTLGLGTFAPGGTYGLTKTGAGRLQFSGTNNAVAQTLGGQLDVAAGTVGIGGRDLIVGSLTGGGTVENGSATGRWIYVNQSIDTTFSGTLQNGVGGGRLGFSKQGIGTITLTGTSGAGTDHFGVEGGAIRLTGTQSVGGANFGQVDVARLANQTALLSIEGGTLNAAKTNAPSVAIGSAAGAQGTLRMPTGTLNVTNELWVGSILNAYGSFTMDGGAANVGNWLAVGRNGNGILNVNGGTLNVTTQNFTHGSFAGSQGVTNLSGSAVVNVTNTGANQGGFLVAEAGNGTFTISGNAALNIAGARGLHMAINGGVGIVNLNGGTVTTPLVQNGTSTGFLNFNGGVLRAGAANATFLQGVTNAIVQSGGAIIDDAGLSIGIGQPLLAPTASGVSSIELLTGGAGYLDTPIVTLAGGSGSGATAVANVAGGVVTGFTITNRGSGYQPGDFLTATLIGGGATTPATTGVIAVNENVSGGLTKRGTGTTTLSGFSTYTGPTVIEGGTLALTGSIAGSTAINVRAGANFDVAGVLGGFSLGATQTLRGDGTVLGNVATSTGSKLSPGQSPGTLTFTGNLDLTLAATAATGAFVFELGTSSDKVALTLGTLAIGANVLGFDDFAFSDAGGLTGGTYTLFETANAISGTLDLANLSGTVAPGFTGTLGFDGTNTDIILVVVPEPSSVALLLGAGALLGLRRRRK